MVPLSTVRTSSGTGDFTLSSSRVTVKNAGTYMVTYSVGTTVTSGTSNRSTSKAVIYKNESIETYTQGFMYNRMQGYGHNNCSRTSIFTLNANDTIHVRFVRQAGSDHLGTISTACGLVIIEL